VTHRPIQSSLARHVASAPDPREAEAMCRRAWQDDGIVCLRLDQIKTHGERWQVEAIAIKLYGKRKGK
jgi:hypothetical protein